MAYIKRFEIKNIQSHKETIIEFDKWFNCIIGTNDVGKTAIIRSLDFLFFNNYRKDLVRDFNLKNGIEVMVYFDDGNKIIRRRDNKNNCYIVNDTVFNNVGNEIPEQVKEKTKIFLADIDEDLSFNLNFNFQLDPPFILSESGSVKTKFLNRITKLNILDIVLRKLNNDIRENNNKIKTLQDKNKEIEKYLEKLKFLDVASKILPNLKRFYVDLRAKQERLNELKVLYEKMLKIKCDIEKYKRIKNFLENIDFSYFINVIERFENLMKIKNELNQIRENVEIIKEKILLLKNKMKDLIKKFEKDIKEQKVCPFCGQQLENINISSLISNYVGKIK
ncbi:MAG: AAA family ATPase [Promethearchaeota archaeon]